LDEVLITVGPKTATAAASVPGSSTAAAVASTAAGADAAAEQQQQQTFADDLGMLGQIGVLEGIKLIAGGLEAVLQRLSVAATNVTIRVEVPASAAAAAGGGADSSAGSRGSNEAAAAAAAVSAGAELILHIDCVHYSDATPAQQQAAVAAVPAAGTGPGPAPAGAAGAAAGQVPPVPAALVELVKRVSVTGLLIELLQLPDEDADGSTAAAAAAAGGGVSAVSTSQDVMRCSQLLYDGSSDIAATAAALRESFMARSSMLHSSSCMSPDAAGAGGAGGAADSAAAAAAGQPGTAELVPGLGGLLLGGPGATGLDFKLELRLAWSTAAAAPAPAAGPAAAGTSSQPPRITADINSSALGVYLQPWQLPLLQLCSAAASNGSSSSSKAAAGASIPPVAGNPSGVAGSTGPQQQQQQQPWGQRSFVEELFFPHVEGFVADSLNLGSSVARGGGSNSNWGSSGSLYNSVASAVGGQFDGGSSSSTVLGGILSGGSSSAAANAASGVYSMYHDARSVFSSVASSISGAVSSNLLSGVYSVPNSTGAQAGGSSGGGALPPAMYSSSSSSRWGEAAGGSGSVWRQQQLQQQPPSLPEAAWSVRALCPSVHVCLHYHAPACGQHSAASADSSASQQQQQQQAQPPCFVLQCGGLSAAYDVSGRASHVSLKVYQLEAFEQLPGDWSVVAGASSSSSSSGGGGSQQVLQPQVLGSVPRVLPAMQQGSAGFTQQVKRCGGFGTVLY
jgi:hypothetical protein